MRIYGTCKLKTQGSMVLYSSETSPPSRLPAGRVLPKPHVAATGCFRLTSPHTQPSRRAGLVPARCHIWDLSPRGRQACTSCRPPFEGGSGQLELSPAAERVARRAPGETLPVTGVPPLGFIRPLPWSLQASPGQRDVVFTHLTCEKNRQAALKDSCEICRAAWC